MMPGMPLSDSMVQSGVLSRKMHILQGIIVTGSASDSFSNEPWIVRLREVLGKAAERKQKILGICFGCQVMALVLGGQAGWMHACQHCLKRME